MLADEEQQSDDSRVADRGKKFCPYCAEEIQEAAIVCRYCGRNVSEKTGGKSKKIIYTLLAGFLVLALITAIVVVSLNYIKGLRRIHEQEISRLSDANAALGSELREMKDELSTSNANLSKTNNELNDTQQELDLSNQQVISVTSSLESAVATQTVLQFIKEKQSATIQNVNAKLQKLNTLLCSNIGYSPFVTEFGGNADVSIELHRYVDDLTTSRFVSATYDVIWNNTKAAEHNIIMVDAEDNERVKYVFIVYYDEEGHSDKGVFWVNRQCWLIR